MGVSPANRSKIKTNRNDRVNPHHNFNCAWNLGNNVFAKLGESIAERIGLKRIGRITFYIHNFIF